jgi:hypothetical protein
VTDGTAPDLNACIQFWRQGDCIPGTREFLFQFDPEFPLTPAAQEAAIAASGAEFASQPVEGLMVISQTCDIVKETALAPFVEVAPLVTLPEPVFREAHLGARPRFATVAALQATRQAADLDRVLTVEKACLARWPRIPGCRTDSERRDLSRLLARKWNRPALPDAFSPWIKPLRNRWSRLARLETPDARAFDDLQEVRVQAHPDWDAPEIRVFLWFILKDEAQQADRSQVLTDWLVKLKVPQPPFIQVDGTFTNYESMRASDYVDSDLLDLGHLSPDEEMDD